MLVAILSPFAVTSCAKKVERRDVVVPSSALSRAEAADHVLQIVRKHLPSGWEASFDNSTSSAERMGLSSPIAQLILIEFIGTGRVQDIVLFVYRSADRASLLDAVTREAGRSDYPLILGETDDYVFVTSPGNIDGGKRSSETSSSRKNLVEALVQGIGLRDVGGQRWK